MTSWVFVFALLALLASSVPAGAQPSALPPEAQRGGLGPGQEQRPEAPALPTMPSVDQTRMQLFEERLHAAGFDPGPVDGILTEETSRAIAAFQRQHGLPGTGLLDEATQRALLTGEARRATPGGGSETAPGPSVTPGGPERPSEVIR